MKAWCLLGLFVVLSCVLATPSALAFRCGGEIIENGDTREEVGRACGEPALIRAVPLRKVLVEKAGVYWPMAVDEKWIYNPGPQEFVEILYFYQGKVVHIDDAGYGWAQGIGKPYVPPNDGEGVPDCWKNTSEPTCR
jgi:hypothetical protein